MPVIEFQAYIDRGTIELPKEYRDRIKGRVAPQNSVESLTLDAIAQ